MEVLGWNWRSLLEIPYLIKPFQMLPPPLHGFNEVWGSKDACP